MTIGKRLNFMRWLHIFGFGTASILGWASFFGFIFFTEPRGIASVGFAILYAGFFIGLSCFFIFSSLTLKKIFNSKKSREDFEITLRRSAMLAFVLAAGLLLQSLKILSLPIMIGLVVSVIFLELYLITKSPPAQAGDEYLIS
ncbi:TPA: hypothetical protein DCP81_02755 [Candidatus Azambacteria bacterium]|nr:hypothetical protein [Candidatus Azambacteria bacterium]